MSQSERTYLVDSKIGLSSDGAAVQQVVEDIADIAKNKGRRW
jgi:hypothetical protein